MSFRFKILLTLLSLVVLSGSLLLWFSHRNASDLVFRMIQEKVLAVAVSAAPQIDGSAHQSLKSAADQDGETYARLKQILREVRDANQSGDLKVTFIYTLRPIADGRWEYVVDAEEKGQDKSSIGDIVEFREGEKMIPSLGVAQVDSAFAKDAFGKWLSAFAPVRDADGNDVALLGVDIEAAAVGAQLNQLLLGGLMALAGAVIAAAVAAWFLARRVSAPLELLEEKVTAIGAGDLSVRVAVEGDDEFSKLGSAINRMASGLQEREAFKGALVRFVSGQASEEIFDTPPIAGEIFSADDRRVTVLSVAMRGFGKASHSLSAERVSAFLNEWYATMIDLVIQHRGSLEKSSGETITATFGAPLSDSVQERHAIEAALMLQQAFAGLRERWRSELSAEVSIRIVIHSGRVAVHRDMEGGPVIDASLLGQLVETGAAIHGALHRETAEIIITASTADGLCGTLPLGDLPALRLANRDEPLVLHTVEMPMLEVKSENG